MRNTRKKKRGLWIDSIFIAGILALIGIILFIILTDSNKKVLEKQITINDIGSKMTETVSEFPNIQIISEQSNNTAFPFTMQYPKMADDNFNILIKDYIDTEKKSYLKSLLAKQDDNQDVTSASYLNISVELFKYEDHYYSFVLTKQQELEGKSDTSVYTLLYNANTQKTLTLRQLLNGHLGHLATLNQHVRTALQADGALKDDLKLDSFDLTEQPNWDALNQVTFVGDQARFYFNPGEVSSDQKGIVTATVPLTTLYGSLAAEFQQDMPNAAPLDYSRKLVALTFDDGPDAKVTTQILNTLDRYNAKATFYMLGNRVKSNPQVAKDVAARGHEIGNHSWSHPLLTKLSNEQVMQEFNSTEQIILSTTGVASKTFRPPYGGTNATIDSMIPLETVMWSIDTLDWKHRNANSLFQIVQGQIHNRSIILMHDIHQSTADGVVPVLEYLNNAGYEFVTVSEILRYQQ